MAQYDAIAHVYDRLNAELDYHAWADFVEACFDRHLSVRPSLVLDLACGTGSMTHALAARGYDMIGVDRSPEMLTEAYARAGEAMPLFLCQDMRSFELYGTVGAAVCCLDSINYLTGDGDLAACFATVHNYLDPDGLFLFDVNTPYKFAHVYGDNAYILEDEIDGRAVWCGWQNSYDAATGLCDFYLTLFEEDASGRYRRTEETQHERCFTHDTLLSALTTAGFAHLGTYADYAFTAPGERTERWYIAARAIKH
ncbi:MAG: class I SAM-dependent methyltransferase [Clostridia bacterium]|nr:class I SAM-dependent methyltransferase [Clostridia bacterium]